MAMVSVTEMGVIEDRLCGSMGLVNAATAELVDVIADVLARGAWEGDGIRSPEQWVAWTCAVSNRRAKRLVLLGTVLPELPACRALFAEGRLTEDHAAVVCRYALPVNDVEVADLAPGLTVTQLARALRILPRRRDLQPPNPRTSRWTRSRSSRPRPGTPMAGGRSGSGSRTTGCGGAG